MIKLNCGHEATPNHTGLDTGYGTYNDLTYCYPCCAEMEKLAMMEHGAAFLYWEKPRQYKWGDSDIGALIDWPGNEIAKVTDITIRRHNMAGTVIYLWFEFEGRTWLGKHYPTAGDYVRCKVLRQKT